MASYHTVDEGYPIALANDVDGRCNAVDSLPDGYDYKVSGRTTIAGWGNLDGDAYVIDRYNCDGYMTPGHYVMPIRLFEKHQVKHKIGLPVEFEANQ